MTPDVKAFFDEATFTITYVVSCPETRRCAVIDSVLDYDPKSGRTSTRSADDVVSYVKIENLTVDWLLETHAHADHLSAAPYLKRELGGQIAIGEHITMVQAVFKNLFNAEPEFATDGSQFDHLLQGVGVQPRIVAEVRTQRAICNMVAARAGVSILDSGVRRND